MSDETAREMARELQAITDNLNQRLALLAEHPALTELQAMIGDLDNRLTNVESEVVRLAKGRWVP